MFDIDPIVWLQSWASPALTAVMNGISLLGYTRAYVAIAAGLAFGLQLRPAVALLVLLAFNAALTDIAKAAVRTPRPDWMAERVQALSLFSEEPRHRDGGTDTEDSYGFPSGHVSDTTAFGVGLALLFRWKRRGWTAVAVWIALMALSRMYLGRHFLGDVLGGVAIGMGGVALAFGLLKIGHLARQVRQHHPWPAQRILALATALAGGALLVGSPDAWDAGRLVGMGVGVLVLVHSDVFELTLPRRARLGLLATAAIVFGAAWGIMMLVLREAEPSTVSALRLAASALPNAALLAVPALLSRRLSRSAGV